MNRWEFAMKLQMKLHKIQIMTLGAAIGLAPVVLLAQDPAMQPVAMQTPAGPQPVGLMAQNQDSAPTMGEQGQLMKDKTFVRKASEGNMAEIQLAQLALQKSSNDGVKQFAQKMIDDHTMLGNKMKPVADNLGVQPPKRISKADQEEYEKLSALSGSDFDKAYIEAMVKDHRKDYREFRHESTEAADPQLKETVTQGTDVIHGHLMMANKLARENGVEVPRPGAAPAQ